MLTVTAAKPQQHQTALSLLFGRCPGRERRLRTAEVLEAAERGEICLDGLILAKLDGEAVGATLFVMQADATAFVWPPVVRDGVEVDRVSDALLRELSTRIDAAGAWLGQCLVEPDEEADRRALVRNGFGHLADLVYLQRPLCDPLPPPAEAQFETVPFDESSNRQRFAGLLERTYVETLDCPSLNGTRSGAEALTSHRLVGEFDPARWKLYRVENSDVGVLLFNDHPDQNAWEVVYMGIVHEARGKGYGRAMLLSGLYEARQAGRDSVLLAVDRRNDYARQIYEELGFIELSVRCVHVRMGIQRRDSE